MGDRRTHHVITTDDVTIRATVHGHGPPLVFVQGAIGDGDLDWNPLMEQVSGRFTCHLPSLRNRGLSGEHPDLRPGRHVEDVRTYVDSIGEPTALVGWSYGAGLGLAVAAQSDAVDAVAPFEPGMGSVMGPEDQVAFGHAVARMGELAADGRFAAAARAFAGWVFDDEEIALADEAGYVEAAGRYVPNLLGLLRELLDSEDHTAEAVLAAISAPVLLLLGSNTKQRFFADSVRHAADHIPDARVHEIPGAGHAAPLTHPAALAEALTRFLLPTQQTA